ncbi:MAG: diheme cytochrome c [Magnetococcales bacterium]|nr:diheme cytochrome c [Magnetococcales bacterium]
MEKKHPILALWLLIPAGLAIAAGLHASDHESREERSRPPVAPVANPLYTAECGACHFPYPSGFLPARSWEKLLTDLGEHFGENAELNAETQNTLREYLLSQAADRVKSGRSTKITASIRDGETPVRITETRYFQHKHREIPRQTWEQNAKVGSLSRCDACHVRAVQGSFDEHEVQIPGAGRREH